MARDITVALDWWRFARGAALIDAQPILPHDPGPPYLGDMLDNEGLKAPMVPFRPFDPSRGLVASGLFRTFADATQTDEGIVMFATDNGPIRAGVTVAQTPGGDRVNVETVAAWREAGDQMRDAIAAWEAARLEVPPTGGWTRLMEAVRPHLSTPGTMPSAYADLLPGPDRPLAVQVVATGLLEALWLQLALAIDGDKRHRACAQCGRWFELDPAIARTSRTFCSDACKSRAARARLRLIDRED
jgi:hypothetical protein